MSAVQRLQDAAAEHRAELMQALHRALPKLFGVKPNAKHRLTKTVAGESPSIESIRLCLAALRRVDLNEVSAEDAEQFIAEISLRATEDAEAVLRWCSAYVDLFLRIGLDPVQVESYLQLVRQLLAKIYFAARRPTPSPTKLRQFAIQLAVDARTTAPMTLTQIKCEHSKGGWQIGVFPSGSSLRCGLPPPDGFITTVGPLAPSVLAYAFARPLKVAGLVEFIELVFGGEPVRSDTVKRGARSRLMFDIDQHEQLRLYVVGIEVKGIRGKNTQALLKHICDNPTLKIGGRKLENTTLKGKLKNASQTAQMIKLAMGEVTPEARDWLATNPLRWATGIWPVKRQVRARVKSKR